MEPQETTVTFLLTEVEGGTRIWERSPQTMRQALDRHDAILRAAIEAAGGRVFKTVGDAFFASFPRAASAVRAAVEAQKALAATIWETPEPLAVRMAIHTGAVEARDGDYFGRPLNRTARILALAQGGQVLLSEVARALASSEASPEVGFRDLGVHALRGVESGERIAQLLHPALRSDFASTVSESGLGNLPRQRTRFVGREAETAELADLINPGRLITVTGTGGAGKTRLAIQAGENARFRFRDGVWFVEFAGLRTGGPVASEIANALGVRETPGHDAAQSLVSGLADRQALLILDNCEHVLDAVSPLVADLLRACPDLAILATSRELLGVAGEHVFRVPPLDLPRMDEAATPERLATSAAVRLFVERATEAHPTFALTKANAPAVAQVCLHLDGVPLALELAAARVRALPVEKLAKRLNDRFRILTAGARTADRRQQTLRGLIDWSYDLLDESEKALLRALPAFGGGWTLEAIESLAGSVGIEDWEVLDLLGSLVDKSLVIFEEAARRYRLLETVRQYAWERAEEADELANLRAAHARYYLDAVADLPRELSGPDQLAAADRIEADHDNLRAAHATFIETLAVEPAQRLTAAASAFWEYRGYLTEGAERGLQALALGESPARLAALLGTGRLLFLHADPAAASVYHEALERAEAEGNRKAQADALQGQANWAFYQKEIPQAETRYAQALALREALDDQPGIAAALHSLGNVRLRTDRLDEAGELFDRALAIRQKLGDVRGVVLTTGALSQLAMAREDYDEVERLAYIVASRVSDLRIRWALAICLASLVQVARHRGDLHRAALLAGTRARVRELTGFPVPLAERADEEAVLAQMHDEMGAAAFDAAYADGYARDWNAAVEAALDANAGKVALC